MTYKLFPACLLTFAIALAGTAQGQVSIQDPGAQTTRAELKKLERSAHEPGQFKALASYYGDRKMTYLQKAANEKREWEHRGLNVYSATAKYPRPVDAARKLYESYMAKASEAGALEAKYDQLAMPETPANGQ